MRLAGWCVVSDLRESESVIRCAGFVELFTCYCSIIEWSKLETSGGGAQASVKILRHKSETYHSSQGRVASKAYPEIL